MRDPDRGAGEHQRGDTQGQLIEAPGGGQLGQQGRPSLTADPAQSAVGEGVQRPVQVDFAIPDRDDLGQPGRRAPQMITSGRASVNSESARVERPAAGDTAIGGTSARPLARCALLAGGR
jgi:hypothetical protein